MIQPLEYPRLRNEVVRLRPWRHTDTPVLIESFNDPVIMLAAPGEAHPFTRRDAKKWLSRQENRRLTSESIAMAMTDPGEDTARGTIMLFRIDWQHRIGMIGYWTNAQVRRRGLAMNAVTLVSRWAFDSLYLERLEITTAPDNIASQRLAERCGFVREGVLRSHLRLAQGRRDSVLYSLLPTDIHS